MLTAKKTPYKVYKYAVIVAFFIVSAAAYFLFSRDVGTRQYGSPPRNVDTPDSGEAGRLKIDAGLSAGMNDKNMDIHTVQSKYYIKRENNDIQCQLCPHECVIKNGRRGFCGIRENVDGTLFSLSYGRIYDYLGPALDAPIVYQGLKKPWLIVGNVGCNMKCAFCFQSNYVNIRPEEASYRYMASPKDLVDRAVKNKVSAILFSIGEATVNYEYTLDVFKAAKAGNVAALLTTNCYLNTEPLKELSDYLDGVIISLKAFKQSTYHRLTAGNIDQVKSNILLLKSRHIPMEFIYVVVPTINDSEEELSEMAKWIKDNVGEYAPLYLSRYYPAYKLKNLPPTPMEALKKARTTVINSGLKYVIIYLGNYFHYDEPGDFEMLNVACPYCRKEVLSYKLNGGFPQFTNGLENNRCPVCKRELPSVIRNILYKKEGQ